MIYREMLSPMPLPFFFGGERNENMPSNVGMVETVVGYSISTASASLQWAYMLMFFVFAAFVSAVVSAFVPVAAVAPVSKSLAWVFQ